MEAVCSNEERPWISIDIAAVLNETLLPLVAECKSESGWDPVKQEPSCIVGGSSPLEEKSMSDGASALSHGWVFVQKAWRLLQGDDQSCEIGALKSCLGAESDSIGAGAKNGGSRKPSHLYPEGATWTRDLEKSLSLSLPIQVCKEYSRSSSNGKKSKKPPRPPKPHSKAPAADDSASAARSAMEAKRISSMQKRVEKIARKNRASAAATAARGSSLDLGTILSLAFTIFVAGLILFQGLASFSPQQKQQPVLLNRPVLQSSMPLNVKEGWTPLILAQHELVVDNDSHLQAAADTKAPTTRSMDARIFLRQK